MDIEGMGEKVVHQLADAGLLNSFGDIFSLHKKRDAVLALERMGEKKADNLFAGIEAAKSRGLVRVLAGLGIHHIGATAARIVSEHFGSIDALIEAPLDQIAVLKEDGALAGIGTEIANSLHTFLHSREGQRVIRELRDAGVKLDVEKATSTGAAGSALAGKTLVVTGTLQKYKREEIESLIVQHGGHAASSVSKKTDYLSPAKKRGRSSTRPARLASALLAKPSSTRSFLNSRTGSAFLLRRGIGYLDNMSWSAKPSVACEVHQLVCESANIFSGQSRTHFRENES